MIKVNNTYTTNEETWFDDINTFLSNEEVKDLSKNGYIKYGECVIPQGTKIKVVSITPGLVDQQVTLNIVGTLANFNYGNVEETMELFGMEG